MDEERRPILVIAEDDDDDWRLAREAMAKAGISVAVRRARNGEELIGGLRARARGEKRSLLILLDLNMPGMDGREALAELKRSPELRRIPVVVMTSSRDEQDVARAYDLGVTSYIRKPMDFERLVGIFKLIKAYWLEAVELPRVALSGGVVWTK